MIRTLKTLAPLAIVSLALSFPAPLVAQRSGDASGGTGGSGASQAEVFRRAIEEIAARHVDYPSDSLLWAKALDGLIEGLNDPYASVYTPSEVEAFDEQNTGNYSGIGVQITQLNGVVTVTKVFRSTPADGVGMMEGDVIVGVEEHEAREWTTDIIADSIRGPAGTDVRVRVERDGFPEPIPFNITRREVHVPAVFAGMITDDVGYLLIDRVARGAAIEVDSALAELPDARALVIDLRRNPGGLLDESLMMTDIFLEPGQTLASLRSREVSGKGTTSESWNARLPARIPETPIVVLVDRFTASAAEIVTGALQDYDRALVLGERTFGKGVVQTVIPLPFDHRLQLTTGTWHTPLGRSLHRARDSEGRPLAEELDTFPTVSTAAGRELYARGGIFPDVVIHPDTTTLEEREFLQAVAESEITLGVRVQEFGFAQAQELKAAGEPPRLDAQAFERFLTALEAEGVPAGYLESEGIREYLAWRTRITIADRMADDGAAAAFRMQRDPVLNRAITLLDGSASQAQLFQRAGTSEAGESRGG